MKKFSKFILSFFTCVMVVLGLVSCGPKMEKTEKEFEAAKAQLIYSGLTDKPGLLSGFDLVTEVNDFQVAYTTNAKTNAEGKKILDIEEANGKAKAVVNAPFEDENFPAADLKVKLVAEFHRTEKEQKVVYGTKEFNVLIGVQKSGVMSWAEYMAAENDTVATIKGVVTFFTFSSSYGNGEVFLKDANEGGYYLYRVKGDDLWANIKVGNEVKVTGKKATSSGLHEFKDVSAVELVSSNNAVTPVDATNIVKAAKDGKAANVDNKLVGQLVKIEGYTLTAKPEVSESGSYNVSGKVGDTTFTFRVSGDFGDAKAAIDTKLKGFDKGDVLTIVGAGNWYSGFQVSATTADNITKTGSAEVEGPTLPDYNVKFSQVMTDLGSLKDGETETTLRKVKGTVVAHDKSGYPYVQDENGFVMYTHNDSVKNLAVGTPVELAGTGTLYNGFPQFGANTLVVVEKGTTPVTVNHGAPVTVSPAEFQESVGTKKDLTLAGKYVEIVGGKLVKDGNFVNLGYGDGKTMRFEANATSAKAAADLLALADNIGQEVTLRGYSLGNSKDVAKFAVVEAVLGNHPTGRVLPFFSGDFKKALPTGWTAIGDKTEWYGDGGLKCSAVGRGAKTSAFEAQNKVEVEVIVRALNTNKKTSAEGEHVFTVKGYNAAGEVVVTAYIDNVAKTGSYYVVLEGTGIVAVEVVMTAFPNNGTKYCNASVGGIAVRKA